MQLRRLAAPALLLLPLALACSDDDGAGPDSPSVATVVVEPDSVGLFVGQTVELTGVALDAAGDTVLEPLLWTTSDAEVAYVEAGGQVTGLQPGRTLVSAAVGEVAGTAVVTVGAAPTLTVSPEAATISVGTTMVLIPEVAGTEDTRVGWLSGDTAVARVAADGTVTGTGVGTAILYATLMVYPSVRDSVTVTVLTSGPPPGLAPQNPTIVVGEQVQMTAFGDFGTVRWESSNTQVATIDTAGLVTGVSAGTSLVTARSVENPNVVASTTVTVTHSTGSAPSISAIVGPNGESLDLQSLSGDIVVVVNMDAPHGIGVAEAALLVDTTIAARRSYTGGAEQWRATADTRAYANGGHDLRAQWLDANGSVVANSSPVHVTFAN